MADVKLFLSCVSDEFGAYRDVLQRALDQPNVTVKIQENFKPQGGDTLRMLQEYIEQCEAVVHFAGDMDGATPSPASVDDLLARRPDLEARLASKTMARDALGTLSYTQWEAWLAIALDRDLLIVAPADGVARGPCHAPTDASRLAQKRHLGELRAINRYPAQPFTSADNLVAQIMTSAVIKALVKAATMPTRQIRNLPFSSSGARFIGRAEDVAKLHDALASRLPVALTGLGGVGKTRLAVEYALKYGAGFTALLFLRADDPTRLSANLAALAGVAALDLPERQAREDEIKFEAVLRWLEAHPPWLMILDNVDDEAARDAVLDLLPRLGGGTILITARATDFPDAVLVQKIGVLDEGAAAAYLLVRTDGKRAKAADDIERAGELARELDGLALGLQQAGAYIATQGMGFARYLETLARESNKGRRLVRPAADKLRPRNGSRRHLGDIGCAAFARKPATARPARVPCPRPDSGFASRCRCSRRGARH